MEQCREGSDVVGHTLKTLVEMQARAFVGGTDGGKRIGLLFMLFFYIARGKISVEQCGIISVEAFEDIVYQGLANEFAAVGDSVAVAVLLQGTQFAVVEHDTHPMTPALFGCPLDHYTINN